MIIIIEMTTKWTESNHKIYCTAETVAISIIINRIWSPSKNNWCQIKIQLIECIYSDSLHSELVDVHALMFSFQSRIRHFDCFCPKLVRSQGNNHWIRGMRTNSMVFFIHHRKIFFFYAIWILCFQPALPMINRAFMEIGNVSVMTWM